MITAFAAETSQTTPASGGAMGGGMGMTIVYLIVMVAIFYFLLIRPQKKREKQQRMMLNDLRHGDEIITIGGVMGNIVNVKDDRVTIETGANKTKITFEKSAIKSVLTVHDDEIEEDEEETEE